MVGREFLVLLTQSSLLGPVPERPISANPGLKFCSRFCILPFCVLPGVAFCVIITVCRSRGSTVFCKLQLHVTSASLDSSPISYLFTYRHVPEYLFRLHQRMAQYLSHTNAPLSRSAPRCLRSFAPLQNRTEITSSYV